MAPTAYPKVPATAWRTLRSRAASAPSTKFTPHMVATLLSMSSPRSAQDNIITPLRKLGLVDDDGSLTSRGNKWRVNASYADACQEILDAIYPTDLASLTDESGKPDKRQINTWMQHQGFGGSNATQMAATYVMIAEKTVPEFTTTESGKSQSKARPEKAKRAPKKAPQAPVELDEPRPAAVESIPRASAPSPNVHLDIQIHIPAEASAEQIDRIFASMAKHLYNRE